MTGASALIPRFARAVATYESEATVQRRVAEQLVEKLGRVCRLLAPRMLEMGCGTGLLTRRLMARFAPSELVVNDLCPEMGICFANVPRTRFLPGDAREVALPGVFDVVASASAVQWLGDLDAFARRCAEALAPSGFLALSGFGPETLKETASLTGKGLRYPTFAEFTATLSQHFEPLDTARALEVLHFPDAKAVLRHLKATGVTATGAGDRWTRGKLEAFKEAYARDFADEAGGVTLTYEPFLFVGRKR